MNARFVAGAQGVKDKASPQDSPVWVDFYDGRLSRWNRLTAVPSLDDLGNGESPVRLRVGPSNRFRSPMVCANCGVTCDHYSPRRKQERSWNDADNQGTRTLTFETAYCKSCWKSTKWRRWVDDRLGYVVYAIGAAVGMAGGIAVVLSLARRTGFIVLSAMLVVFCGVIGIILMDVLVKRPAKALICKWTGVSMNDEIKFQKGTEDYLELSVKTHAVARSIVAANLLV